MTLPPRRVGSRRGFTLVELLVAITILSVALLALAGSMAKIMQLEGSTERRGEMSALAGEKLVELEVSARRGITPTTGGSLTSGVTGFTETVTSPSDRSYLRRWTIDAGPVSGTFRLAVRVSPVGLNESTDLASMVFVP